MMQRYYVIDREIAAGEHGFDQMVARAYTLKQAVRCLCRRDIELDLYIPHPPGGHVLSRWPGTGPQPSTHFDPYDTPAHLTALVSVLRRPIRHKTPKPHTTL